MLNSRLWPMENGGLENEIKTSQKTADERSNDGKGSSSTPF